jgi:hypothetical protein
VVPRRTYRADSEHDVTAPAPSPTLSLTTSSPSSPLWGLLGGQAWSLHTRLTPTPTPTATLALATALPAGGKHHGCGRLLHQLAALGLAEKSGHGRGTRWRLGATTIAEAAESSGACDRLRALRIRTNAERAAWHAESRREQSRTQRTLHRVLEKLRTENTPLVLSRAPLVLLDGGSEWSSTGSLAGTLSRTPSQRRRFRSSIRRGPPTRGGA